MAFRCLTSCSPFRGCFFCLFVPLSLLGAFLFWSFCLSWFSVFCLLVSCSFSLFCFLLLLFCGSPSSLLVLFACVCFFSLFADLSAFFVRHHILTGLRVRGVDLLRLGVPPPCVMITLYHVLHFLLCAQLELAGYLCDTSYHTCHWSCKYCFVPEISINYEAQYYSMTLYCVWSFWPQTGQDCHRNTTTH